MIKFCSQGRKIGVVPIRPMFEKTIWHSWKGKVHANNIQSMQDRKSRAPIKLTINILVAWFLFTHCRVAENRRRLIREICRTAERDHRHSSATQRSRAQRFDGPRLILRRTRCFPFLGKRKETVRPPRPAVSLAKSCWLE